MASDRVPSYRLAVLGCSRVVGRVVPWVAGSILAAALTSGAFVLDPAPWLPVADEARSLLLGLLGAQAAIAALTLAVALFVLQGVGTRRDADHRAYREYVRLSHVRWISPWSVIAVATTGAALVVLELGSAGMPIVGDARGLLNLTLVACSMFVANLVLSGWLFERATSLSTPATWQRLRRRINERDVRVAVRAFVERQKRLSAAGDDLDELRPDLFPGDAEGSADEAVRALLDDARRAMNERRTADLAAAITALQQLLEHAMEEIERAGVEWSAPASGPPSWPPLSELSRELLPFRDEVIRRRAWEYIHALDELDRWLLVQGLGRRCGELFTAGLQGYRRNYAIAIQTRSAELREYYRDRVWLVLRDALTLARADPEVSSPYLGEAVRHQEALLARALHEQLPEDFRSLRDRFAQLLRSVGQQWDVSGWPRPDSADIHEALEMDTRVALLGLGGRAFELVESGQITEPGPYLAVVREEYVDPQRLADDLAQALASGDYTRRFSWLEWQAPATIDISWRSVDPPRYVLLFSLAYFLDRASGQLPDLDLHGVAEQVRRWLDANAGRLERHLAVAPDVSIEQRQAALRRVLDAAVQRDAVAEEDAIIARPLSPERVKAFVEEVHASRFSADAIERVFADADASVGLPEDADGAPEARGSGPLVPKAPFTDSPPGARIQHARMDGRPWGKAARDGVVEALRMALADAPLMNAVPMSAEGLLGVVDDALSELEPSGEVLVLLVGDWADAMRKLDESRPAGYESRRWVGGTNVVGPGEWGRYKGHPLVWRLRSASDAELYVVDPLTWGRLVRVQGDGGSSLAIEVGKISLDRAQALLAANPDQFPDEPDEAAKLRKLQACVSVDVWERTGFRVDEASRARKGIGTR